MLAILRALRLLRPVLQLRWWMLALLILLGLLTAISEGFSISLIIPLLASGAESAQQSTSHWFAQLFSRFSGNQRIMMIAACFLAGVVLKNALSYAYGVLSRWLNATMSHRLRSSILTQVLDLSQLYLDSQQSGKLINTLGSETWRMALALSTLADMLIDLCMVLIFGCSAPFDFAQADAGLRGFFPLRFAREYDSDSAREATWQRSRRSERRLHQPHARDLQWPSCHSPLRPRRV